MQSDLSSSSVLNLAFKEYFLIANPMEEKSEGYEKKE